MQTIALDGQWKRPTTIHLVSQVRPPCSIVRAIWAIQLRVTMLASRMLAE
jgi:hypothetical protein